MVEVTLDPERGYRTLRTGRGCFGLLDRTIIPHFPIPDSRFPILEFRIPNSVWHMGNLEYRTMRLGGRGAHMKGT